MAGKREETQLFQSHARVETVNAGKYLQQLCKHFAHKVAVDFDREKARVEFPPGPCLILAEDDALSFFCQSVQQSGLERIQLIIDDHLKRFAWREEPVVDWQAGLPEQPPLGRLPGLIDLLSAKERA